MKPWCTMPLAAWPVSSAFSESFMRGAVPWPSRSSGTKAAPSRRRSLTDRCPTAAPSIDDGVGIVGDARSPDSAEKSSSWPLPATPAMPRISPPCTSNGDRSSRVPCGSSGSSVSAVHDEPRHSRRTAGRRPHLADLGPRPSCARAMPRFPGADRRSRSSCRRAGWSRCRTAASPRRACG